MKRNIFINLSNSKFAGEQTARWFSELNLTGLGLKSALVKEQVLAIEKTMEEKHVKLLENPIKNIQFPPPYLYARGSGQISSKRIAIIGSRRCTAYGRKMAFDLAKSLSERGVTIVSGLAYGIDASAHRGALSGVGGTIAVLGSGVLNCYPKEHLQLYEEIVKEGMIISEYGLYSKPLRHHFPFRNRIIAALADAVVVVEAKERSGTMITVGQALQQGKDVFCIPGNLDSDFSAGTNRLIQQGARVIVSIDEFVDEITNRI